MNSLLFISNKNKLGILVLFLVFILSACTGAGPTASPLSSGPENSAAGSDNKPGSSHTPGDSTDNTDNSESPSNTANTDSGAVAILAPPAQPTQPLTPHLAFFVEGTVLFEDTDPNAKCEKNFASIPTVKVWTRDNNNSNWKLDYEVGKYESDADANNPYVLNLCGTFRAALHLLVGPKSDPCNTPQTNEVRYTASYKDPSGTIYTGESHIYTCKDGYNFPQAKIILKARNQMMMQAPLPAGFL